MRGDGNAAELGEGKAELLGRSCTSVRGDGDAAKPGKSKAELSGWEEAKGIQVNAIKSLVL